MTLASRPIAAPANAYSFEVRTAGSGRLPLAHYRGQAILIVNVASRCGFTSQYAGLEALHRRYKDQGFTVLGFPCNQFGGQEPGTDEDIQGFCTRTYEITFPVLAKIDVKGTTADPFFQWLTGTAPGWFGSREIKWNFTKFLIDREGRVVKRYAPGVRPTTLARPISRLLASAED